MIPRSEFDAYDSLVRSQAEEAMSKMREFADGLHCGDSAESRKFARDLMQSYAYDCITEYGDNAGEIAARFYDEIARISGAEVPEAVIADYPSREQVNANVAYATRSMWEKTPDGRYADVDGSMGSLVGQSVYGHVNRMANFTQMDNAKRDGAKYARVPTGKHTCAFCTLLASRGFVYNSEETALYRSLMRKYHDGCDCRAVSVFDDEGLEGYDTEEYEGQYSSAVDALPDKVTRAEFKLLSDSEQKSYGKVTRGGRDAYNNYRLHRITEQMREMHGLK